MKMIVGVADMKLSNSVADQIITHALGSCLGIAIYDSVARVGGLLHVMLPSSSIDPAKAAINPFVFVDTGLPKLFLDAYKLGARKEHIELRVAGGACAGGDEENDYFQIGKRNFLMLKKMLWKNNVIIRAADVGGNQSRTMSLNIADGQIVIRSNGVATVL